MARIVLKNKNEWKAALRADMHKWCVERQYLIAQTATAIAKQNVPPKRKNWRTTPPAIPYKPKGRLMRNIRHDRSARGRNVIKIKVGVGRRGHPRFSAPIHEFGKTIRTPTGRMMRFRPGKGQPFIVTNRVRIRPKFYLKVALLRSLNQHAVLLNRYVAIKS